MHIMTGIIGIGILALPQAVAYLGWVAGCIMLILFFLAALLSARMLASVYVVDGIEHSRYHHAGALLMVYK